MERLVSLAVNASRWNEEILSENDLLGIYTYAKTEKENIRQSLINTEFSLKKEKFLELQVQRYQASIIRFLDALLTQNNALKHHTIIQLRSFLITVLEELLSYIESHFSKYFNINEKVPGTYLALVQKESATNLKLIKRQLAKIQIPKALEEVLTAPISQFIHSKQSKPYTYRQLMYIKTLVSELSSFNPKASEQNHVLELIELMVYLNFNSHPFFNYTAQFMANNANALQEPSLVLEQLRWYKKTINQFILKPLVALHYQTEHIKDQLAIWVSEEINFLEKKQQLSFVVPSPKKSIEEIEDPIPTSLSVPQLAFVIRLLKESNLIKITNRTRFMERVARNFTTIGTGNITPGSINAKSYSPELATIKKVKDILINLLNLVRKIEADLK